jgi:hypothetical protein
VSDISGLVLNPDDLGTLIADVVNSLPTGEVLGHTPTMEDLADLVSKIINALPIDQLVGNTPSTDDLGDLATKIISTLPISQLTGDLPTTDDLAGMTSDVIDARTAALPVDRRADTADEATGSNNTGSDTPSTADHNTTGNQSDNADQPNAGDETHTGDQPAGDDARLGTSDVDGTISADNGPLTASLGLDGTGTATANGLVQSIGTAQNAEGVDSSYLSSASYFTSAGVNSAGTSTGASTQGYSTLTGPASQGIGAQNATGQDVSAEDGSQSLASTGSSDELGLLAGLGALSILVSARVLRVGHRKD